MMDDGLRTGMFLAGVVMAAAPVALGIAITVWLVRMYRRERDQPSPSSPGDPS